MDYEKKYKEALEWARKVMQGKVGFVLDEVLEKFPELKESEGERIRKGIIECVKGNMPDNEFRKAYLAWLEKQGEQKEPKRIIDEKQIRKNLQDNSFRRMFEQNPAWSEEDESMRTELISYISGLPAHKESYVDWLKSIKDRVLPLQKQEWSEDDERILSSIINDITTDKRICKYQITKDICDSQINWLKSLRPQNKWKPSEEQINVCKEVYADILSAEGFDLGTINSELNRLEEELHRHVLYGLVKY